LLRPTTLPALYGDPGALSDIATKNFKARSTSLTSTS
jgi:hypothetical protein